MEKSLRPYNRASLEEVRAFLNLDTRMKSANSASVYRAVLGKYWRFIESQEVPWDRAERRHISSYMDVLKESGMKNTSINTHVKALKRLYRMAQEAGQDVSNPAEDISYYKTPKCTAKHKWLKEDQLKRVFSAAKDGHTVEASVRDIAIVSMLFYTGARASELADMKLSDIIYDDAGKPVEIRIRSGKGDKSREVELSEKILAPVLEYHRLIGGGDYLFYSIPTGRHMERKPLNRLSLYRIVKRIGKRAGLNVWTHCFRHSYATHALKNGADITAISHRLGHASTSITLDIYCGTEDKVLDSLPELLTDGKAA